MSGVVSSVNGALVQIAGGTVTIDASNAKITLGRGAEGTIADIKPGMQLFAAIGPANPASHGGLPATIITVTDPADAAISGVVQTVDAAAKTFSVLNQTITVDANTSFGGYKRDAGTSFSDLQPNVIVHVQADNAGGKLVAREVLILAPLPPQVGHARGTVESIGTDSWTVKTDKETITVVVNAQTKIAGSPKVGDTVEVLYTVNSAHQFVAVSIIKFEPRPAPPQVSHARGTVESIGAESWTVKTDRETITLTVNAQTKIGGSPKVGDSVEVVYTVNSANQKVALSIIKFDLRPPTPPIGVEHFRGNVKSITGPTWVVTTDGTDRTFTTNDGTKIMPGIVVGDLVEVMVLKKDDGTLVAVAILKLRK